MIWCIIVFIVSIIALALILIFDKKEHGDCSVSWWAIIFTCWALTSLVLLITYNKPSALDVYRGKTTLEITYRDSVAIDSTVVYKVK